MTSKVSVSDASARENARPWLLSGSLLVLSLAVTLSLSLNSVVTARSNNSQQLASQISGVSSAVSSTINSLQAPLVAADHLAGSLGQLATFRDVVASDVGAGAPFRSILLFDLSGSRPRLISSLGQRSNLSSASAQIRQRVLAQVKTGNALVVATLWERPVRALGFVEYLPGLKYPRAIYAESSVPANSTLTLAPGSPLYGLNFAMYLGTHPSRDTLIESTVPTPVRGVTTTEQVNFGNARVTVIAVLSNATTPSLFAGTALMILLLGVAISLLASSMVQWLALRRRSAEGRVVETSRQFHREREVSHTLQRALLPEESLQFPGVELATAYRAGTRDLEVGGDWYDAFSVDEDTLVLTVGDVSGRGLAAATVMGSLRHAIRAYAMRGEDPASILSGLGELVSIDRDRCFATVLVMKLRRSSREVTVASAGHLAPVIADDAGARMVPLVLSPPIGVRSERPVGSSAFTLGDGAVLLAYTDGLVERRGESIDEGLDRLKASLKWTTPSLDRLVDSVLDQLVGDELGDDVAVLALRVVDTDGEQTFSQLFACHESSIARCRRFVEQAASSLSPATLDDVVLVVSELATNAITHARSSFRVRITLASSPVVRLEVTDSSGAVPEAREQSVETVGGRGLHIVSHVARQWGVVTHENPSSTTIWAEFDVRESS